MSARYPQAQTARALYTAALADENSQHYILDVVFNEDASRIAMEDAVEKYGAIPAVRIEYRKTEQLWCSKSEKQAKRAGWNDDYRAQLFFG